MNQHQAPESAETPVRAEGVWSPLTSRVFSVVLFTNLFTMLAVFMNGTAGAWILTDITDSPSTVAALQIAVALPTFLLALIAGAMADIASRKRIVLLAQGGSVIVAAAFALLAATDSHTIVSILGLTAALGVLTALAAPAWLAAIPGLVPRFDLAGAMTLSSAGVSTAMAVGPAVAGFVIAGAGPTAVFTLNALVFAGGMVALRYWQPKPRSGLPAEHMVSAIRVGVQYVWYDKPLRVVIGKVVPFAFAVTALIALLPAVARFKLEAGPAVFGLLAGAGGIGAVLALLVIPRVRKRFGPDTIVLLAMLVEAGVLAVLATTSNLLVAFAVLVVAGGMTLAIISTLMTALQIVLPAWIRGRGVAVYLLVLQGSFALGAVVWGLVGERTNLETALLSAGAAMAVGAVVVFPLRLGRHMDRDTEPVHLVDVPTVTSVHDDDGPILLTATWDIAPERRAEFVKAMEPVRRALRRQGALSFRLAEDVENPGRILESFTLATWSEYKRLPERAIATDQETHDALLVAANTETPGLIAHRVIDTRTAQIIETTKSKEPNSDT